MKEENQEKQKVSPYEQKKGGQQNPLKDYVKYSGLAFQMCFVIGLAVWGGMALDDKFMNGKPVFVLILAFVGIGASMYLLVKSLPKG